MNRGSVVVLSGAGVSAESGLSTFRDFDGMWDNYRAEELATSEAFSVNAEVVLDFCYWHSEHAAKA